MPFWQEHIEHLGGCSFISVLYGSFRWSKSPISNLTLEGYFVRVRLGKWEEGLGGTGYHMARIIGKTCTIWYTLYMITEGLGGTDYILSHETNN